MENLVNRLAENLDSVPKGQNSKKAEQTAAEGGNGLLFIFIVFTGVGKRHSDEISSNGLYSTDFKKSSLKKYKARLWNQI